jgi:hypothetical protein
VRVERLLVRKGFVCDYLIFEPAYRKCLVLTPRLTEDFLPEAFPIKPSDHSSRIVGNGKKKRCPPVGVWGITGKQIGALPKDRSSQQSGRTFFQGLIR